MSVIFRNREKEKLNTDNIENLNIVFSRVLDVGHSVMMKTENGGVIIRVKDSDISNSELGLLYELGFSKDDFGLYRFFNVLEEVNNNE